MYVLMCYCSPLSLSHNWEDPTRSCHMDEVTREAGSIILRILLASGVLTDPLPADVNGASELLYCSAVSARACLCAIRVLGRLLSPRRGLRDACHDRLAS